MLIECGPRGEPIATVVCQQELAAAEVTPADFVESSCDPVDL
jgi:hypothetical protein